MGTISLRAQFHIGWWTTDGGGGTSTGGVFTAYQANGVKLQITEPTSIGNKFYRLQKP